MIHYKKIVGRISMKSSMRGKAISASAENVTPFGTCLFVKGKEYSLTYEGYPFLREQVLCTIQDVQLLHGCHLY